MFKKFTTKKVSENVTVGEFLRQRRNELELSLEEVSQKLKIKTDYIIGLEENDYDILPPDVYIKGFIRHYSELAGFDPEKMVKMYSREKKVKEKIKNCSSNKKKVWNLQFKMPKYTIITPGMITVFFSFIILSLLRFYFWHQISSFRSVPYLFISSPASDSEVDNAEVVVEGKTETEAVLRINGENVFVEPNGHFKENIVLQPGKNTLIVEAKNKFDKVSRKEINIIYDKKQETLPVLPADSSDNVNYGSDLSIGTAAEEKKEENVIAETKPFFSEENIETIGP